MFTIPYFTIESPRPITTIEFHHRDGLLLAGGLMNGQVAIWDMRKGFTNVGISEIRNGHRDPILSLKWIQSKTNSEFMTGSSDGQVNVKLLECTTKTLYVLIFSISIKYIVH